MFKIFLAGCCAFVLCQVAQARTWTDAKGNKVEAELVGAGEGMVSLRKGDRTIKMPISNLSKSDQYFINLGLPSKKGDLRKPPVSATAKHVVSKEQYQQRSKDVQQAKQTQQSKQGDQAKAKDSSRQVYSASDKANAVMKKMLAARGGSTGFKKGPARRSGST